MILHPWSNVRNRKKLWKWNDILDLQCSLKIMRVQCSRLESCSMFFLVSAHTVCDRLYVMHELSPVKITQNTLFLAKNTSSPTKRNFSWMNFGQKFTRTRMHSSRMCTAHFSSCLSCTHAPHHACPCHAHLPAMHAPPPAMHAHPNEQNDWQTGVKTLPSCNFVCGW